MIVNLFNAKQKRKNKKTKTQKRGPKQTKFVSCITKFESVHNV